MFYGSFHKFHKPDNSFYKDYEIQGYFGQFGIVHFKHSHQTVDGDTIEIPPVLIWAVPPNYDNIFRWGWKEVFILSERGKVGAVRCVGDTYEWIVPCEYNAIDGNGWVVVFSRYGEKICYFDETHRIKIFSEVSFYGPGGRYIFAIDTSNYYIIDSYSEAVLWSCSKCDPSLSPYTMFGEVPCLVYMGTAKGLPMFFDCINANYILPIGGNELELMPDFPNVIMPIIVQGKNIVNIIDGPDTVYAGSFEECLQQSLGESEEFDEVTVEIKVTLKSETHTEERCYPIPNSTFFPGDTVSLGEWYDYLPWLNEDREGDISKQ